MAEIMQLVSVNSISWSLYCNFCYQSEATILRIKKLMSKLKVDADNDIEIGLNLKALGERVHM